MKAFLTSSALHSSSLTASRLFLDCFTRLLPSIRPYYKDSGWRVRVQPLMPAIQVMTRVAHALCDHGKLRGVRSIIGLTPQWKKSADAFIFAVKGTLGEAGLLNIFTQGQLKSKALDGQLILTQPQSAQQQRGGRAEAQRGAKEEESEGEEEAGSGGRGGR